MFRFIIYIFVIFLLPVSVMLGQGMSRYDKLNAEQKSPESSISLASFSIYPNPAISYFSILGNDKVSSVEVYNLAGKMVTRWEANESNHYMVSDLKNGLYLVRILDKNKKVLKVNRLTKE